MAHLKCLACETRLHSTDGRADPIGDLCPVCGPLLEPVGDLSEIVGYRVIENCGSTSHSGASVASQLTAEGDQHAAAGAPVDAGPPTRDDAQRLVDLQSAAHGRQVTFAMLARAGVAWSAAVTCQLEFVGAPVQRVYEHGRPVGARLDTHERRPPRHITTSSLPAGCVQRPAPAPRMPRVIQAFR